jgi:hypothetical protein
MEQRKVQLAQELLVKVASEFQNAGGAVSVLSQMTLLEFIRSCAYNNIELTVKYKRIKD